MHCPICGSGCLSFGQATVLGKYTAEYFRCSSCGFVHTEPPYWLAEAYARPVASSDLGMVGRNLALATVTKALIVTLFRSQGTFLDYGGGYGLFTRVMRDSGFNFLHWDEYCPNLFAEQFSADPTGSPQHYDLVTAFEVFEHLVDPVSGVRTLLALTDSVLFTTALLPSPPPSPGEWWFYGVEHGQHVSLFTRESLARLAAILGVHVVSDGVWLHMLTTRRVPPFFFRLITRPAIARCVSAVARRPSLLAADYQSVTGRGLL